MVDEVYRFGSGGHGGRPAPVESEQHPRFIGAGTDGRDYYSPSPTIVIRAAAARSPGRHRRQLQQHQSAAATAALDPATAASMAASYPSVVQAERILQLRRELGKANEQIVMSGAAGAAASTAAGTFFGSGGRSPGSAGGKKATAAATAAAAAAWRSHRDDVFLRDLAEKDYHMAGQLGE